MYSAYKHAAEIFRIWTTKDPRGETAPVMFSDTLAELFFFGTVASALEHAYRVGRRDEQKTRKRKAVKRYLKKAYQNS